MKTRSGASPRAILGAALLTGACANVLGFSSSDIAIQCVSSADCAQGFECVNSTCTCASACTSAGGGGMPGGQSGVKGGAAGSGDASMMAEGGAGEGASSSGGTSGEGGHEQGGATAGTPGRAGTSAEGGESGTPERGGSGGRGPANGGTSGAGAMSGEAGMGDVGGEGGSGGAVRECDPKTSSPCICDGTGHFITSPKCFAACLPDGTCAIPPSCNGLTTKCGLNADMNCCLALPVPGGDFDRGCDETCRMCSDDPMQAYPATISTFALDAFEVSVGRFRHFVASYPASKPSDGAGKNPRNPDDQGWQPDWSSHLPLTSTDLQAALTSTDCFGPMWTPTPDVYEAYPMNCVSWYLAQAFCIWDGGRLPTAAEWNYAAAGGKDERVYPWSTDPNLIDSAHAVFQSDDSPAVQPDVCGSRPDGVGRWGQFDLAGNVAEWVWDGYTPCYATSSCEDCGQTSGLDTKLALGGSYLDYYFSLTTDSRSGDPADTALPIFGIRCARDILPTE